MLADVPALHTSVCHVFTRYTFSEQIFRGKFGGFTVAAKHVFASDTSTADFTREAVIMANLAHPFIVAFYGIAKAPTGGLSSSSISDFPCAVVR